MSEPRKSTARHRLSVAPPPPAPPRPSAKLAVGDQVQIGDNEQFVAEVRFIGPTSFAEGEWVGVQCKRPIGKNDGSVQGIRYFECQPNHGLFARATNLVKLQATQPATPATPRASEKGMAPRPRASYAAVRAEKDPGGGPANSLLVPPDTQAEHLRKELAMAVEDHDFAKLRHVLPQASTRVGWREVESGWKLWDFEFCRLREAEALHGKFFRQMMDIEEVRCLHMEEIQKEMRKGLAELRSEVAGVTSGLQGAKTLHDNLKETFSDVLQPVFNELADLRSLVRSQTAQPEVTSPAQDTAQIGAVFNASLQPLLEELAELRNLVKLQVHHAGKEETPSPALLKNPKDCSDKQKEEKAATKIQAIHRGNVVRQEIQEESRQKNEAATKVQARHRGNLARQADAVKKDSGLKVAEEVQDKQEEAATKIQAVHRGKQARKEVQDMQKEAAAKSQESSQKQQEEAATKIQAIHRGNVARQEVQGMKKEETSKTQVEASDADGASEAQGNGRRQEDAATKIQAVHRGNRARQDVHDLKRDDAAKIQDEARQQQEDAATKIQAVHRGNRARQDIHDLKRDDAAKIQDQARQQQEDAATKIQAVHRGNRARQEVHDRHKDEAAKIQVEASDAGRASEAQDNSRRQEDAATKIQAVHRGNRARQDIHDLKRDEAAKIQDQARQQQEDAATKIQAVHRGNRARQEVHDRHKDVATKIQAETDSALKGQDDGRRREDAATKIQAVHRGNLARQEVNGQKEAKIQKDDGKKQADAATKIQAVHRGNLARQEIHDKQKEDVAKTQEGNGKRQEDAATKIQAVHRGNVARQEVERQKEASKSQEKQESPRDEAATKIQAVHRGNLARQEIQDKKEEEAAPKIQAGLRGNLARQEIQEKRQDEAATKIQSVHRGNVVRQEVQERKQQEEAASKIQASFRGNLVRQEIQDVQHEELQDKQQEEAAIKIQAIHRGNLARKAHLELPPAPGGDRRRSSHRLPKLTEVRWSHAVQVPECYKRGAVRVAETHRRAIRLSQLRTLSALVEQVLQIVEVEDPNPMTKLGRLTMQNVNLYHMNELFVLRLTESEVCSFTELVMDGPQDPSWFVSHWWGTPWRDSLSILGFHAEVHKLANESPYWICTFANNQHNLEELNTSDLLETPFVRAIMSPSCQGTVMLMNENAEPFRRTWCTLENFISTQHVRKKSTAHHFEVGAVVQEGMQKITVNDEEQRVPRCPALLQQGDGDAGFIDKVAYPGAWFPNEVASSGVKVDIATANASNEDDKRNILRLIIGETDPGKMPEPPVQHAKYDEVNIAIHRVFAPMALHDAAQDGNVAEVERLLQAGLLDLAGKPTRNSAGETPLFAACANGRAAMVQLLLTNRADPNLAKSTDGVSPACAAIVGNHREVLELLLSSGANLNAASKDGGTPLLMCIQAGHYGLVERLLEAKADPNGDIQSTQTPVQFMTLASAHRSEETDFEHACETLQLLLQARADPDSGTGASALLAAAGNNHVDALEILLEAGANPNQRDPEYQATVLSWAAHNANVDAVTALIQHRADINAVSGGETPLDVAKGLLASDEPTATSAKACLEALKSMGAKEFKEL